MIIANNIANDTRVTSICLLFQLEVKTGDLFIKNNMTNLCLFTFFSAAPEQRSRLIIATLIFTTSIISGQQIDTYCTAHMRK